MRGVVINAKVLGDACRLGLTAAVEVLFEGVVDVGGDLVEDVEVIGLQISVGGFELGVHDELDAVVAWLELARVVLVRDDGQGAVVLPIGQLVGACADGVFAVGFDVF